MKGDFQMENYFISITIDELAIQGVIDTIVEAHEDGDNKKFEDAIDDLEFFNSIKNGTTVHSLQEYFGLLDRISQAWEEYRVDNKGTHIFIGG